MTRTVEFYLQVTCETSNNPNNVCISRLAEPLSKPRQYSIRSLSRPHIVLYVYWSPALPDYYTRERVLPALENYVKDLIAADARLYAAIETQLDGEDWSFADEISIR